MYKYFIMEFYLTQQPICVGLKYIPNVCGVYSLGVGWI